MWPGLLETTVRRIGQEEAVFHNLQQSTSIQYDYYLLKISKNLPLIYQFEYNSPSTQPKSNVFLMNVHTSKTRYHLISRIADHLQMNDHTSKTR